MNAQKRQELSGRLIDMKEDKEKNKQEEYKS